MRCRTRSIYSMKTSNAYRDRQLSRSDDGTTRRPLMLLFDRAEERASVGIAFEWGRNGRTGVIVAREEAGIGRTHFLDYSVEGTSEQRRSPMELAEREYATGGHSRRDDFVSNIRSEFVR